MSALATQLATRGQGLPAPAITGHGKTRAGARVLHGGPPGIRTPNLRIKSSFQAIEGIGEAPETTGTSVTSVPCFSGFCYTFGYTPTHLSKFIFKNIGISVTSVTGRLFGSFLPMPVGFCVRDARSPP